MGYYFSGTMGYGVEIPEDFEPEDWDEDRDWWDYLEEVCQKFEVEYAISDYLDEFLGAALFVGKTTDTGGVGVRTANPVTDVPTVGELERLREAAEYVGVPYEPVFLTVTSYG